MKYQLNTQQTFDLKKNVLSNKFIILIFFCLPAIENIISYLNSLFITLKCWIKKKIVQYKINLSVNFAPWQWQNGKFNLEWCHKDLHKVQVLGSCISGLLGGIHEWLLVYISVTSIMECSIFSFCRTGDPRENCRKWIEGEISL